MKTSTKMLYSFMLVLTQIVSVAAHNESDQGYYGPGMMWSDGGWMHNGAHMAGYNMWGLG